MEAESGNQTHPLDHARRGAPGDSESTRKLGSSQLITEILDAGHLFDFFRLVTVLERLSPDRPRPGQSFEFRAESIRFRPDPALVFPPADVKRVEWSGEPTDPPTVVVRFFGLYGFDSPLPAFYHADLARETKDTLALRDFLDIFNHRFYSFFYRAWKKYRPSLQIRSDGRGEQSIRFLSVGGLGTTGSLEASPVPVLRLAAFAGLLANRTRNADGLRRVIEGFMPGCNARIRQNLPRWVRITDRPSVGSAGFGDRIVLGENAMLGERVFDIAGKYQVILGPLGLEQFEACLPGRPGANKIRYLTRMYAPDFLDYDVILRLRTAEVPKPRLGDQRRKLGLNMWLGRPSGDITERTVKYGWEKQAA
ncbi:MAG: type VI secretion system baseplate subunit TssG [Rhodothermia bacterium]|nr:type VI secretion system baseplate subunit TssG [Rhodothermia bacterium]